MNVKNRIVTYFKNKIEEDGKDKSKIQFLLEGRPEWKPVKRQRYLDELSRANVSTIFQARTRMLDIKNNFRNKYPDITCRACKKEAETQEHVLETCQTIHQNEETKTSKDEIFNEDPDALQVTAEKIRKNLEKLNSPEVQFVQPQD